MTDELDGPTDALPMWEAGAKTPFRVPLEFQPDIIRVDPPEGHVGAPWALVGGEERDGALDLYLVVAHGSDENFAARIKLTIPMVATGGELLIGTPQIV